MKIKVSASASPPFILLLSGITYILISELLFYYEINTHLINNVKYCYAFFAAFFVFVALATHRKSMPWKTLRSILVFCLISVISTSIFNYTNAYLSFVNAIKLSSLYFVPYVTLKTFTAKKFNKYKSIIISIFIVLLSFFLFFFLQEKMYLEKNTIYYILFFLPFCAEIQKKRLRVVMYFIIFLCTIISMKRLAFVGCCAFIIISYLYTFKTERQGKKRIYLLFAGLFVGALVVLFIGPLTEFTGSDLLNRLNLTTIIDSQGSYRFVIFNKVIEAQNNSGFFHWITGSGYNGVISDHVIRSGYGEYLSAHNDFLEVLYDYGIFGLGAYLAFFISLFSDSRRYYRTNMPFAGIYGGALGLMTVISLGSHLVIYFNYIFVLLVYWAICRVRYHEFMRIREGTAHSKL